MGSSFILSLMLPIVVLCFNLKISPVEGINVLPRATRNAEGTHEECCGKGKTEFTKEEQDVFVSCSKRYEDLECSFEEKLVCITWCVADKYQVVDKYGYVNGDVFQTDMKEIYPEECVKKLVTKHAQNCADISNQYTKEHWEGKNLTLCNPSVTLASRCLINNVDVDCPEELKSHSGTCEKRREHLTQMKERY